MGGHRQRRGPQPRAVGTVGALVPRAGLRLDGSLLALTCPGSGPRAPGDRGDPAVRDAGGARLSPVRLGEPAELAFDLVVLGGGAEEAAVAGRLGDVEVGGDAGS